MTSPCEEGLQTVDSYFPTASLIPLPVYECEHHETDKWNNAGEVDNAKILDDVPVDQGQDAGIIENEIPAFAEIQTDERKVANETTINDEGNPRKLKKLKAKPVNVDELRRKTQSPTLDIDDLPAIAVTPGSSISNSSFEEVESTASQNPPREAVSGDSGSDYVVEVRKRYSNDDKNSSENRSSDSNQSSASGTNSPKSHLDEKRRIDKSKRRKGVYIQWAALDKHAKELSAVSWSGGDSTADSSGKILPEMDSNGQPIWPIGAYAPRDITEHMSSVSSLDAVSPEPRCGGTLKRLERMDSLGKSSCISCEDSQTPASFDAFTPEPDCRPPIWSNADARMRRQSLSLQSSEEKDESPSAASSPPTSKPHSKLFLLRSDSISDNEMSDRTPPPRDRTSQSPAPGEDLKRYSKRPLRGPYGQMLEAEMKKPAKKNYDGLLEELNRSER